MAGIFTKRIWQPCICQPNELKREIKKKTGGQAKIWGAHGPLRPPLRIATVCSQMLRLDCCLPSPIKISGYAPGMLSHAWNIFKCMNAFRRVNGYDKSKAQTGEAGGAQAPPLGIRILMIIVLVFHQHWSRDRVHCRMFFGSTTRRSNTFVIKPSGYEVSRFEKYWAAFFIPAWFVLPYITRAGCYRALSAWKQAWHLNYQQCRLMCRLYVTKLGPS